MISCKNLFTLFIIFFANISTYSQTTEWAYSFGAEDLNDLIDYTYVNHVIDDDDNLYLTGALSGSVDFDSGPEEYILESDGGEGDIFVVKFDADGYELTYTVSLNGNSTTISVNESILTIDEAGIGKTTVTVLAGDNKGGEASDKFEIEVKDKSAIAALENSSTNGRINIYPNPASKIINIKHADSEEIVSFNIEVYNLFGQKQTLNKIKTRDGYLLNVKHLPRSYYLIKISSDDDVIIKKVLMK